MYLRKTKNAVYLYRMVCDFFYPQLGGVEFHIYHLAQNLLQLGHSVVVITHAYKDRVGIRYLTNGLKVYHVPFFVLHRETSFPSIFSTFPIVRNILLREQVDIVHSHGSVSTFAHQAILHANTMGIKTVFTDHSLYGFDAIGSILVNKLLTFNLTNIDSVICVSNTCKENMVMRADLDVDKISVIPNAVVSEDFRPRTKDEENKKRKDRLTIVVISRLFPNKGADLLVRIIPIICQEHKDVDFIIAGDGPKFIDIQQMIESQRLEARVTLLGSVPHEKVRDVMCKGDIYLHASLTEAFGTVLVEAASCGLLIVTTTVGGIPEVLPEHMTVYAKETSVSSLIEATGKGIHLVKDGKVDPMAIAKDVSVMYDWMNVAQRTVSVYDHIFANGNLEDKDWVLMVTKFFQREGSWARLLYVLCCVVSYIMLIVLDYFYPRSEIDLAIKWPTDRRSRQPKTGDDNDRVK